MRGQVLCACVCVRACACVCVEPECNQSALASAELPFVVEDPAHDMYEYTGDRIELEWLGDVAYGGGHVKMVE